MPISRRAAAVLIASVLAWSPIGAVSVLAATQAADDSYVLAEDTQLQAPDAGNSIPGLLDNDTNDGGTACVAAFDTTDLAGTLDATSIVTGAFTYTPPPDFNGETSFGYTLGTVSGPDCVAVPDATAAVTITVTPVNDAPIAVTDSFTALRDRSLNVAAPGVLGNDSDVDGDELTAIKTSSPAHGVVTLAADGGFSYTPAPGYVGPDAFAYKASDGTAESLQRIVSINVVDLPPTPSPTPIPTPTSVPPTASPEPSPTESPLPSDSGLPTEIPVDTGLVPSASPSGGPVVGPVADEGGPPIIAIGALVLLVGLLAVAAVFFVRSQRQGDEPAFEAGEVDDEPVKTDEPDEPDEPDDEGD